MSGLAWHKNTCKSKDLRFQALFSAVLFSMFGRLNIWAPQDTDKVIGVLYLDVGCPCVGFASAIKWIFTLCMFVCSFLLQRGASLTAVNCDGDVPLDIALDETTESLLQDYTQRQGE